MARCTRRRGSARRLDRSFLSCDRQRVSRFRGALPWVLFLTFIVYFSILPRLLVAPLLLRISDALGVTFEQSSSIFLSGSFGFVTGLLISGFVASRIRHRGTITLVAVGSGLLLILLSFSNSLLSFHIVFAGINLMGGLYPGSGVPTVSSLVPGEVRGTALAIHETGPNLAFLTAPLIASALAPWLGWRAVFVVVGIVIALSGLAFAIKGKGGDERGQPPRFGNIAVFLRSGPFWIVSVMFVVAAAAAMGVYSVLPTYLVIDHGLSEGLVNTVVGLSRITGFASILLAGTLSDRFGFARTVAVFLGITGLVTIAIGVATGPLLLAAVFVQPLTVGAFFPIGLSALTTVGPPGSQNLAVALAIPLANLIGAGVMPRMLARAGAAGRFDLGFVLLGVATVVSLLLLLRYPRRASA